jgi:hypothetical protein
MIVAVSIKPNKSSGEVLARFFAETCPLDFLMIIATNQPAATVNLPFQKRSDGGLGCIGLLSE